MTLINITVMFCDTNKYTVQVPHATKLGMLSSILPIVVGRTKEEVLYLIMNGQMLGYAPYQFDKTLADCQIVNNECMVHLIFKDPKIKYNDYVLSASERNQLWRQKQSSPRHEDAVGRGGRGGGMMDLLQSLGQAISMDMGDVVVTIPDNDYNLYVTTNTDDVTDQSCAICQEEMNNDQQTSRLSCGHCFHEECLHDWLTTSSTKCPTCNYDVRND